MKTKTWHFCCLNGTNNIYDQDQKLIGRTINPSDGENIVHIHNTALKSTQARVKELEAALIKRMMDQGKGREDGVPCRRLECPKISANGCGWEDGSGDPLEATCKDYLPLTEGGEHE